MIGGSGLGLKEPLHGSRPRAAFHPTEPVPTAIPNARYGATRVISCQGHGVVRCDMSDSVFMGPVTAWTLHIGDALFARRATFLAPATLATFRRKNIGCKSLI